MGSNSVFGQAQVEALKGAKTTKQTELGVGSLSAFVFPLPPLTEQHRIVAKVKKLMAACDALEAEVAKSRAETDRLMQTILKEAFAS